MGYCRVFSLVPKCFAGQLASMIALSQCINLPILRQLFSLKLPTMYSFRLSRIDRDRYHSTRYRFSSKAHVRASRFYP